MSTFHFKEFSGVVPTLNTWDLYVKMIDMYIVNIKSMTTSTGVKYLYVMCFDHFQSVHVPSDIKTKPLKRNTRGVSFLLNCQSNCTLLFLPVRLVF